MAQRLFCNGCGDGPLREDDVKRVVFAEATLTGTVYTKVGNATDVVTEGVLCLERCVPAIRHLVSEHTPTDTLREPLEKLAANVRVSAKADEIDDEIDGEDEELPPAAAVARGRRKAA